MQQSSPAPHLKIVVSGMWGTSVAIEARKKKYFCIYCTSASLCRFVTACTLISKYPRVVDERKISLDLNHLFNNYFTKAILEHSSSVQNGTGHLDRHGQLKGNDCMCRHGHQEFPTMVLPPHSLAFCSGTAIQLIKTSRV